MSGGVFVASDSDLGSVIDKEKRSRFLSVPGNEGSVAQAWVTVRGGTRVFAVYFLALTRMDTEKCVVDGSSGEAGENHQASLADGTRCQHGP